MLLFVVFPMIAVLACTPKGREKITEPQTAASWRVLGPGGGGAMFLPTINPADPANVFLRCDMTGVYVTHDSGESWRMFNLRTVVRDFEFSPLNPNTVYAANSGLFRSEDRGQSWRLVFPSPENVLAERMVGDHAEQSFVTADGVADGRLIDKVRVDPSNSEHLYLGLTPPFESSLAQGYRPSLDTSLVLVSRDRGASWKTLAKVRSQGIHAIFPGAWDKKPGEITVITDQAAVRINETTGETAVLPLPVKGIICADGGRGSGGSVYYVLGRMELDDGSFKGGIYRSVDRGETWAQANGGLLDDLPKNGRTPSFATLAVCEGQAEVGYLSCSGYFAGAGGQRQFGILKTLDAGKSWTWVFRADSRSVISGNYDGGWIMEEYGPEWGEYPLSMGVSPSDPDICYASDFGCTYRTTDGGAGWKQVYTKMRPNSSAASRGLDVTVCYGVQFDPFDKDHLFANYTDIGALQSFNGGESWFHATRGIPRSWINGCYWTVFDPEVKGRAWSVWSSAHDLPRPKMMRRSNLENASGGVAVSEDGCRNWKVSNTGMPQTACTHIVLDPNSPSDSRTLYVCGFGTGVYKSVDSGRTWNKAGEIPGKNKYAWRLALLPDNRLFLLVARGLLNRVPIDGALYCSNDGGGSWQTVPLPEGVNAPNDLAVDPANPQRMFLSLWPWVRDGREVCGGLLLTEDGGTTWRRVFREDVHVFAAAIDPENPDKVYINTFDSAAFASADGGQTWSRIKGYNFKWGHRPVVDPHNPGMLFLSTFGGGLFHGPAAGVPGFAEDIVNFSDRWRWGD